MNAFGLVLSASLALGMGGDIVAATYEDIPSGFRGVWAVSPSDCRSGKTLTFDQHSITDRGNYVSGAVLEVIDDDVIKVTGKIASDISEEVVDYSEIYELNNGAIVTSTSRRVLTRCAAQTRVQPAPSIPSNPPSPSPGVACRKDGKGRVVCSPTRPQLL